MRSSANEVFMAMAFVMATRGTCSRRNVGCVLVDQNNFVLSTGYNGAPKGAPHCIDSPCGGSGMSSGQGLAECEAIHAEQNALLQCKDVQNIHTCYTTTFPCMHCFKMLCNTGCERVVYFEGYAASGTAVNDLNNKLAKPMEMMRYDWLPVRHVCGKADLATLARGISAGYISGQNNSL